MVGHDNVQKLFYFYPFLPHYSSLLLLIYHSYPPLTRPPASQLIVVFFCVFSPFSLASILPVGVGGEMSPCSIVRLLVLDL